MLYNVVLISAVQQSESAICIHISPYPLPLVSPSHPPYPIPLGHHKAVYFYITLCILCVRVYGYSYEIKNMGLKEHSRRKHVDLLVSWGWKTVLLLFLIQIVKANIFKS